MASKVAFVIARNLAQKFRAWLPSMVVVESLSAGGNPVITVSADATPAAGEQVMVVMVSDQPSIGQTSVGTSATSYAPQLVQLCMESEADGGVAIPGVALVTLGNMLPVLGECVNTKARLQVYLTDTAVVPSVAAMVAANQVASFDDLYFPFIGTA